MQALPPGDVPAAVLACRGVSARVVSRGAGPRYTFLRSSGFQPSRPLFVARTVKPTVRTDILLPLTNDSGDRVAAATPCHDSAERARGVAGGGRAAYRWARYGQDQLKRSLVVARENRLTAYGTLGAQERLVMRIQEWVGLGMPRAATYVPQVFPIDTPLRAEAGQWIVKRRESRFLWGVNFRIIWRRTLPGPSTTGQACCGRGGTKDADSQLPAGGEEPGSEIRAFRSRRAPTARPTPAIMASVLTMLPTDRRGTPTSA